MREIPQLQSLCLRAVGPQTCSAETTFASTTHASTIHGVENTRGNPTRSQASKLLQAFHKRPVIFVANNSGNVNSSKMAQSNEGSRDISSIPMARSIVVGKGSSRRANANDVDLNHPIIAHRYIASGSAGISADRSGSTNDALVIEYGNPALDFLQSYIDSLVELGRMDDSRLGIHFFEEWKANVLAGAGLPINLEASGGESGSISVDGAAAENTVVLATDGEREGGALTTEPPRKRSRHRSDVFVVEAAVGTSSRYSLLKEAPMLPLGSLSLNNCAIAGETIDAMLDSRMGLHLAVLDLGGIYQLNDAMLGLLLPQCPNLRRFSIKNCRRVSAVSLNVLAEYQTKLNFLDIGGAYNITAQQVLDAVVIGARTLTTEYSTANPSVSTVSLPCPELIELNASGLGWNDDCVKALSLETSFRPWKTLSLGFSFSLSSKALRKSLFKMSSTLTSLALHFCEHLVDNALMGTLGRNLPNVKFLDVRGNPNLTSMTGWYDGRASVDFHVESSAAIEKVKHSGVDKIQEVREEATESEEPSAVQDLTVLARFTNITSASLEETRRIHPLQARKLYVVFDGGGHGIGVNR